MRPPEPALLGNLRPPPRGTAYTSWVWTALLSNEPSEDTTKWCCIPVLRCRNPSMKEPPSLCP
jgi:hypothetical protein